MIKMSKQQRVVGYLAASKDKGTVTVMVESPPGTKNYYTADLNEALNVLTGRQAYARLYERRK